MWDQRSISQHPISDQAGWRGLVPEGDWRAPRVPPHQLQLPSCLHQNRSPSGISLLGKKQP